MERTTIGSFPRGEKPLDAAIRDVVDLQLRHGVEVVTDGEQRADMITYFEQITGFGRGSRGLRVSGRIKPMDDPRSFYKLVDHSAMRAYLASTGRGGVKTKITLTGPVTLGMTAAMGGITGYSGLRDPTLYGDCADALAPLAEEALKVGALPPDRRARIICEVRVPQVHGEAPLPATRLRHRPREGEPPRLRPRRQGLG